MAARLNDTTLVPVVVALSGELDIATIDATVEYARSCRRPGTSMVLDVSAVMFCDCSGLRALLRIARETRTDGGEFALSGADPRLTRLLAITGLRERLPAPPTAD